MELQATHRLRPAPASRRTYSGCACERTRKIPERWPSRSIAVVAISSNYEELDASKERLEGTRWFAVCSERLYKGVNSVLKVLSLLGLRGLYKGACVGRFADDVHFSYEV